MTSLFSDAPKTIPLDGSAPALKHCRFCGCPDGVLQPERPPHGRGVRCADCNRHLGWLPKGWGEPDPDDDFAVVED